MNAQNVTSAHPRGPRRWLIFVALAILVSAVAVAGSLVTMPKIPTWYASLNKPFFSPPNWVFGPVWTLLYGMMTIAAWRIWLTVASSARRRALIHFFVQLALNAIWSPVFFGMEAPHAAFAVIVALLFALAATVREFFVLDRIAGWLLVPYLVWVAFAALLNGAIAVLN